MKRIFTSGLILLSLMALPTACGGKAGKRCKRQYYGSFARIRQSFCAPFKQEKRANYYSCKRGESRRAVGTAGVTENGETYACRTEFCRNDRII